MKIDVPIEIQGIIRVVVDQDLCWIRSPETGDWILEHTDRVKNPHQMATYIRSKLRKTMRRGWVKGETLNICYN